MKTLNSLKLKIMVSEIWLTLYENCVPDLSDKRSVSHTEKARIDILRRFIQENYAEKIKLEDIAASAHISRGECCRIFKRLYGTKPFQYLVHYRLTRRQEHLADCAERRLLQQQLLHQVLPLRV